MSALLFPGQGSQAVGMGLEFYNNFEIVKKIFKLADEKLNYPISKIILRRTRRSITTYQKHSTSNLNSELLNIYSS